MNSNEETYFAKPGRSTRGQLTEQAGRCLDDPCVKVVLEAVSGYLVILNENRQILAANEEFLAALTRSDPGCVVGLRFGEAMNCIHFTEGTDGCGTSKHCRTCGAVLAVLASDAKGEPAEDECRLSMYRNGKLEAIDFKVRATPLPIHGADLTAFVVHDVSALKRREVLEQVFLHDFLDALGGIAVWSELLKQADQQTAAREIAALVDSLKEEVVTQRTLLDAERGELVVKPKPFDAAELTVKLEAIFRRHPAAEGKVLSIAPLPSRTRITSDPALLMRVLVHMLKNAFEATAPGGTVRLWLEWEADSPTFVVENAGVIPEHAQARLFDRSFSTHGTAGRGIGTYSMKLYGERYLGGRVRFVSSAETATRFMISLPDQVKAPGRKTASDRKMPSPAGGPGAKRVVLVDDDEALLRLGTVLLSTLGYTVQACLTGEEALAALRAAPAAVDAVITDLNMPRMSGRELVARLREIRGDVPIIVCTGMGGEAAGIPGIAGCLSKPFTFQELERLLKRAISKG